MKGLDVSLQLVTTQMVVYGASFQSIIDHAMMTESILRASQEGAKRMRRRGEFTGHISRGRDCRGFRRYHGRPLQAALQSSGNGSSGSAASCGRPSSTVPPFIESGHRVAMFVMRLVMSS